MATILGRIKSVVFSGRWLTFSSMHDRKGRKKVSIHILREGGRAKGGDVFASFGRVLWWGYLRLSTRSGG